MVPEFNVAAAVAYNARVQGTIWKAADLPPRFRRLASEVVPVWAEPLAGQVALFQALHGLVVDGKLGPATLFAMRDRSNIRLPLRGKGLWIWNESQLPERHVEQAAAAGIQHVLIKVADHASVHPHTLPPEEARRRLRGLFAAYRAAGIQAVPWVYAGCYEGDSANRPVRLLREAELHMRLAEEMGSGVLVVNAEKGFKRRYTQAGKTVEHPYYREHATRYLEALRFADLTLLLSSYCFPKTHGTFPWAEMIAGVHGLMPQTYWSLKKRTAGDPIGAIGAAAAEWRAVGGAAALGKPMAPSGGLYQTKGGSGWPDWHRPAEIQTFVRTVCELLVPCATFWWYVAPRDDNRGKSRVMTAQWNALANAPWMEG
jgi:hypothetical protein